MNRRTFSKLLAVCSFGSIGNITPKAESKSIIKSKQKFIRGQRVKIIFPQSYKDIGQEAIVISSDREDNHSYLRSISDHFYTLLLLNRNDIPHHNQLCCWYNESDLVLDSDNRDIGEQIYQNWLDENGK